MEQLGDWADLQRFLRLIRPPPPGVPAGAPPKRAADPPAVVSPGQHETAGRQGLTALRASGDAVGHAAHPSGVTSSPELAACRGVRLRSWATDCQDGPGPVCFGLQFSGFRSRPGPRRPVGGEYHGDSADYRSEESCQCRPHAPPECAAEPQRQSRGMAFCTARVCSAESDQCQHVHNLWTQARGPCEAGGVLIRRAPHTRSAQQNGPDL